MSFTPDEVREIWEANFRTCLDELRPRYQHDIPKAMEMAGRGADVLTKKRLNNDEAAWRAFRNQQIGDGKWRVRSVDSSRKPMGLTKRGQDRPLRLIVAGSRDPSHVEPVLNVHEVRPADTGLHFDVVD